MKKTYVTKAIQTMAGDKPAHAKLSCSGSKIWLTCTPSIKAQEPFPNEDTEASLEGTLAHHLAALQLAAFLAGDSVNSNRIMHEAQKLKLERFLNSDFLAHVDAYLRRSIISIGHARQVTPDALVLVEQELDLRQWIPEGFGTGDLVIISDRLAIVRDLKFGKGVRVEVDDNSQLKLYGLGAIAMHHAMYGFDRVRIEIDQPRMDNVAGVEYTVDELLEWGEKVVKPTALIAAAGGGELVAGEHCTFCRARNLCKKRAEHTWELASSDFLDHVVDPVTEKLPEPEEYPNLLTQKQIEQLHPKLDLIIKFASDLKEYIASSAISGRRTWAGYKLVEGRANRVITDPEGLVAELELMGGVDRPLLYEAPKIVGLGEMEKLVGKKVFEQLSAPFVTKPRGKPTLVPISDKRPEWVRSDSADDEFSE
jgi:hypothetical protein